MKKHTRSNEETLTIEQVTQLIEGTDDASIAQGLALGCLNTIFDAGQEITQTLFEGSYSAEELLKLLQENIAFVRKNFEILNDVIEDFDETCKAVRQSNE